jgi:hypothetical protein
MERIVRDVNRKFAKVRKNSKRFQEFVGGQWVVVSYGARRQFLIDQYNA